MCEVWRCRFALGLIALGVLGGTVLGIAGDLQFGGALSLIDDLGRLPNVLASE